MNIKCLFPWIGILLIAVIPLQAETDWSFWAANETSYLSPGTDSLVNPDQLFFRPDRLNADLVANGLVSWKPAGGRIRFQAAAAQKLGHAGSTRAGFLLREAFAVFTLNENVDISVGKKLVKWGTGAGYNPTGFADPPKNPQDPNDRLSLNQGTELIQVNFVRSTHSIDFLYFAPRLYFTKNPILSRDRLAVRYNRLWRGLDFSIMGLVASGSSNKMGANYSYVLGRNVELHGELSVLFPRGPRPKTNLLASLGASAAGASEDRAMPAQSVLGGSYTFRSGWTLVAEWHHDGEGLNRSENRRTYDQITIESDLARQALTSGDAGKFPAIAQLMAASQMLGGVRQNRDALFLMTGFLWGHEKYSMQSVVLRQMQDGSTALIPSFNAQLHRNWQAYLRTSFFMGKRKSEYGSTITKMVLTMGLRYNL